MVGDYGDATGFVVLDLDMAAFLRDFFIAKLFDEDLDQFPA